MPARGHGPVSAQVIPGTSLLQPAGRHGSILPQVIPLASIQQPARSHTTVLIQVIPSASLLKPAGPCPAVFVKRIPYIVNKPPAGSRPCAVRHLVPASFLLLVPQTGLRDLFLFLFCLCILSVRCCLICPPDAEHRHALKNNCCCQGRKISSACSSFLHMYSPHPRVYISL